MVGLEFILNLYNVQQSDLAEKLGITKQNVNHWVKDKQKIPKKHVLTISELFKIPSEFIQKELDELDKVEIQKIKLRNDLGSGSIDHELTGVISQGNENLIKENATSYEKRAYSNESDIEKIKKDIYFYIKLLALGLVKREQLCVMDMWDGKRTFEEKKALSNLFLIYIKLNGNGYFSTNINELSKLIITPLSEWGFPLLDGIFGEYEGETILYDRNGGGTTEFCHNLKLETDYIEYDSKKFIDALFKDATPEEYSSIREFIIRERLMASREVNKKIYYDNTIPEQFKSLVEDVLEDINQVYYDKDNFRICPYCGHPLRYISGEFKCIDERCKPRSKHWGSFEMLSGRYKIVKPSLWRFIVYPGLMEIRLFDKIKSLNGIKEAILYPYLDFADIQLVTTTNEIWMIDVKDWKYAFELYRNLNYKVPFTKGQRHNEFNIQFDKAILVVPDSDKKSELQIIKKWNTSNIEIYTESGFLKMLRKRFGDINEINI